MRPSTEKPIRIKGGALNLGLNDLADSARDLEFFIKRNNFFPESPEASQKKELFEKVEKLENSIPEIVSLSLD